MWNLCLILCCLFNRRQVQVAAQKEPEAEGEDTGCKGQRADEMNLVSVR